MSIVLVTIDTRLLRKATICGGYIRESYNLRITWTEHENQKLSTFVAYSGTYLSISDICFQV